MGKKRTDSSRYQSVHTKEATFVTGAQYAAEVMCVRRAASENKSLPQYFWQADVSTYWSKIFIGQVIWANRLTKQYGAEAVVKALQDPRTRRIQTLSNTGTLIRVIKEIFAKLKTQEHTVEYQPAPTTTEQPRPSMPRKQSTLSKLKDIEEQYGQDSH